MKHARTIATGFLTLILMLQPIGLAATNNDPKNPLICARLVALRIRPTEEYKRNHSIMDVARAYMALGRLDQFMQVFREIGCNERFSAADYFADQAMKFGMNDYALSIINQAFLCVEQDPAFKSSTSVAFVEKLIKLNQFDRAAVVAESLEDETSNKATAFASLADEYAKRGRHDQSLLSLDRAFINAKTANEDLADNTLEASGTIAAGYAKLGMRDKALEVLEFANELAGKQGDFYKPRDKREVAVDYAMAGFDEKALLMTKSLDHYQKLEALLSISALFIQRGQVANALGLLSEANRLINESESEYNGSLEYLRLVDLYLQANVPDEALKIASGITQDYCYTQAAVKIAEWSFERKNTDLAIRALDDASRKAKLIVSEKPEEISPCMCSSRVRSKASDLSQIANRYIQIKQFDKARSSIEAIDLPQARAMKLADLAIAMVKASSEEKSTEVLNKARLISRTSSPYPLDWLKDETLANIARGYASVGNKKEAVKLFAEALRLVSKLESYDDRIERLTEVALSFEQSGIETDDRIRKVLKKIISDWDDD